MVPHYNAARPHHNGRHARSWQAAPFSRRFSVAVLAVAPFFGRPTGMAERLPGRGRTRELMVAMALRGTHWAANAEVRLDLGISGDANQGRRKLQDEDTDC